jgi:glycosyltransferase involved in cell wall biosynthesis
MKKLLYIVDARIPTEKAHGYQIMKMCEAFAERGLRVELVVPRMRNSAREDAFSFYGIPRTFAVRYLPAIDRGRSLPMPFAAAAHGMRLASFALSVRRFLSSLSDADTVVYTRTAVLVPLCARRFPVCYEVHGLSKRFFWRAPFRQARLIVTVTNALRRLLSARGIPPRAVCVAPDGVDMSLFAGPADKKECRVACGLPPRAALVGYAGRFAVFGQEKGIAVLIRAMSRISADYPHARLLLVGGPASFVPGYYALADRCGLGRRNVIYIPHVPAHAVPRLLRACDALAIPLPLSDFAAYYTSPLKLFEYMASGVPVIASDLPALREIINEENAFFARPGDDADWAHALSVVLARPDAARARALRALVDVRHYTWHTRAERILACMSS